MDQKCFKNQRKDESPKRIKIGSNYKNESKVDQITKWIKSGWKIKKMDLIQKLDRNLSMDLIPKLDRNLIMDQIPKLDQTSKIDQIPKMDQTPKMDQIPKI